MNYLVKEASGIVLYSVYNALNLVFFKKKKRIVFISLPDATDNSWYLYSYALAKLENYEITWLVQDNYDNINKKILDHSKLYSNNNKVKVTKRWSIKGLVAFSSARFVFHTHGTYFYIKKAFNAPTIVNLWHGMPIKAIGLLDNTQNKNFCYSDYSIATSDSYREIMSNAFNVPVNRVLSTGLPRNDVLYSGVDSSVRDKILRRLDLDKEDGIIVWLPTYRVSSFGDIRSDALNNSFLDDLDSDFLEELDALCSENNIKIIIKLHPMDSIFAGFKDLRFSNIQFYDAVAWKYLDIELYDLISLSKGVVSDFSSVMIDCLPTNISVGFINSSRNKYSRKTIISVDELLGFIHIIDSPVDIVKMARLDNVIERISSFNNSEYGASEKLFKYFDIN